MLRALGFQSRTVQRASITESLFVTVEGVVIRNRALDRDGLHAVQELRPVPDGERRLLHPVAPDHGAGDRGDDRFGARDLWPARQASRIRPAVALRTGE